ncbi:MAG: 3-deoxy-7-phosphoheptulonate synthase [Candidatus Pararuminococcus gallinarum]|jgi:3-deoxy-7-phosphoheptulonate synthase|uniref:3-deoxy-7-phosphoheptulonate synthase n=1 Tax=Zongyangia sp. HA2173 TaxID=3133035 RepID=UPI00174D5C87
MVVILKEHAEEKKVDQLLGWLELMGVKASIIKGSHTTILGLVGDTSKIDIDSIRAVDIVENVTRVQEPYKNANRKFHPDNTVIDINGRKLGGDEFHVISGPCSVESEAQILEVARRVKAAGATMLRGGAFKPRTSPYAFQGLRAEGIEYLLEAKKETGMPIVTEIMSIAHLDLFNDVDVIQVGARNMQNFELLKELGKSKKPILLKRGLANTLEELLMSAEYIMAGGNPNVILCERGIRTFETFTRNTLDISAVPILKQKSHLPVVVDPSHATGITWLVEPLSKAAVVCGADGLIIEVHNNPAKALSDGPQSLTPDQFDEMMVPLRNLVAYTGRKMG